MNGGEEMRRICILEFRYTYSNTEKLINAVTVSVLCKLAT